MALFETECRHVWRELHQSKVPVFKDSRGSFLGTDRPERHITTGHSVLVIFTCNSCGSLREFRNMGF